MTLITNVRSKNKQTVLAETRNSSDMISSTSKKVNELCLAQNKGQYFSPNG